MAYDVLETLPGFRCLGLPCTRASPSCCFRTASCVFASSRQMLAWLEVGSSCCLGVTASGRKAPCSMIHAWLVVRAFMLLCAAGTRCSRCWSSSAGACRPSSCRPRCRGSQHPRRRRALPHWPPCPMCPASRKVGRPHSRRVFCQQTQLALLDSCICMHSHPSVLAHGGQATLQKSVLPADQHALRDSCIHSTLTPIYVARAQVTTHVAWMQRRWCGLPALTLTPATLQQRSSSTLRQACACRPASSALSSRRCPTGTPMCALRLLRRSQPPCRYTSMHAPQLPALLHRGSAIAD